MPTATHRFRGLSPAERSSAIARAAESLASGKVVVLPTETVYGVAVRATDRAATERFASLPRPGLPADPGQARPPWTWHAPTVDTVLRVLPPKKPVHRRLFDRLAPGPVRFVYTLTPDAAGALVTALGVVPGALDGFSKSPGMRQIAVRIPRHEITTAVLTKVGSPVVVERLARFGLGEDPSAQGFAERASAAGIDLVLEDGPAARRVVSTSIEVTDDGYRVLEEGAVLERTVKRLMARRVLFVCTGNTCRSPMAEAIARHLVTHDPALIASGIDTPVSSAGTSAADGAPATPEALDALHQMHVRAPSHRSRAMTPTMIDDAEIIYTMTPGHRDAVLEMSPSARSKVHTLDPGGQDIADPIGGNSVVYLQTAHRLRDLIRARLIELDAPPKA